MITLTKNPTGHFPNIDQMSLPTIHASAAGMFLLTKKRHNYKDH